MRNKLIKGFFFKTELKKNRSVIRLYFYASNAQKNFTTCPPISFSHNIMTKSTEKKLRLELSYFAVLMQQKSVLNSTSCLAVYRVLVGICASIKDATGHSAFSSNRRRKLHATPGHLHAVLNFDKCTNR